MVNKDTTFIYQFCFPDSISSYLISRNCRQLTAFILFCIELIAGCLIIVHLVLSQLCNILTGGQLSLQRCFCKGLHQPCTDFDINLSASAVHVYLLSILIYYTLNEYPVGFILLVNNCRYGGGTPQLIQGRVFS